MEAPTDCRSTRMSQLSVSPITVQATAGYSCPGWWWVSALDPELGLVPNRVVDGVRAPIVWLLV